MKRIFCALIAAATLFASTVPAFAAEVNTAPSTDIDGTKHRLVKSVKVYCADYDTNEWSLDYTQNVEYQNAYPTMIEQVYSDEELGSSKMLFEYTFENNLPKTSVIKNDANHETTKIEYNNGRVYNVHTDNEGGGSSDTIYQYANGDGYFTSLLGSRYTPGTEYSPEEFAEEMDSVQIITENGVIKKGDCRDSECAYYPHKHVTFGDLQNFPKSASRFFEPRYLHHETRTILFWIVRVSFCNPKGDNGARRRALRKRHSVTFLAREPQKHRAFRTPPQAR